MSISELEIKWLNFVRRLRVVGVLLIFVIIPFLGFVIIPIHFILTMVAVGDVSKLNRELKDPYLQSFRSKYITASIIKLIGSIIVHAGALMLAVALNVNPIYDLFYYSFFPRWIISPIVIVFIVGFVSMIIGSITEIGAWNNLKLFVYHNKELFPVGISYNTTAKVENLRSGAVAWALGFLVITILIGWIHQLVGYFGLSNVAEKRMKAEPIAPKTQAYQAPSPPTPPTPPAQEPQQVYDISFCPMCGSKVSIGATFCKECGVKLVN